MPVCIHLGTKLAVHVDETYEQEQIAALADLGVELRCETLDAALALPPWPCRLALPPPALPDCHTLGAPADTRRCIISADGVEEQDDATASEWFAEADCLMMVGHVHVGAELLDRCPKCVYVCSFAVGYDTIDIEECTRRNIYVSSGAGSITETTADVALFLLLGCTREHARVGCSGWLAARLPGCLPMQALH